MSARLADLHLERARLGRLLASVDEAIAAELCGAGAPAVKVARAKAPRIVVIPEDRPVSDVGRQRARGALRRRGVALGPERGGER